MSEVILLCIRYASIPDVKDVGSAMSIAMSSDDHIEIWLTDREANEGVTDDIKQGTKIVKDTKIPIRSPMTPVAVVPAVVGRANEEFFHKEEFKLMLGDVMGPSLASGSLTWAAHDEMDACFDDILD